MEIEKVHVGEKSIYYIKGRIDTATSPELQQQVEDHLNEGEKDLVFDFEEVLYMSSAGLRVILYAKKRIDEIEGGNILVRNVAPVVMEVFEMTGFTDFLTIESKK